MPKVLITGASRGIGRATSQYLAAAGWDVVAGVRNEGDAESLRACAPERISPLRLDITDPADVTSLAARLGGRLDAVVNNAGIVVGGPVEGLALDELRRQLEVNVTGQIAVTQAVLPLLRESRGRIVFISSLSGLIATPMFGAYNASKFALEGIADALRMELAPWKIDVSIVEPAQTDTDLWRNADEVLSDTFGQLSAEHRELYAKHIKGFRRTIPKSQRAARPADGVSACIQSALTDKRPRARYVVGRPARAQLMFARALPTRARDVVIGLAGGVPRRP